MSNEIYQPHLSAEQRCQAVAAILARGVLRCHRRIKYMNSGHVKNPSDFSPGGLEVLDETRLTDCCPKDRELIHKVQRPTGAGFVSGA